MGGRESGGFHTTADHQHLSMGKYAKITSYAEKSEHLEQYTMNEMPELITPEMKEAVRKMASEGKWRAKTGTHRASFDPSSNMIRCTCWGDTKVLWCSHIQQYFLGGEVDKDLGKQMKKSGQTLTIELPVIGGWAKVLAQGTVFAMEKLNGDPMDQRLGLAIVFPELDGIEAWMEYGETLYKAIKVADDWIDALPDVERMAQLNDFDTIECGSVRHGKNVHKLQAKRDLARRTHVLRNFIKGEVLSLRRYSKCTICATPRAIEQDIPVL